MHSKTYIHAYIHAYIHTYIQDVSALEESVSTHNPEIFALARSDDDSAVMALQKKMKALKKMCKVT